MRHDIPDRQIVPRQFEGDSLGLVWLKVDGMESFKNSWRRVRLFGEADIKLWNLGLVVNHRDELLEARQHTSPPYSGPEFLMCALTVQSGL